MIDFTTPKFWVKNKGGGYSYPEKIEDWFSQEFKSYYIYEHPILLYENREIRTDKENNPIFKEVSFQDFQDKYSKDLPHFSSFQEFTQLLCKKKKPWPKELFGIKECSSFKYDDIVKLLKVIDDDLTSEVYIHYDALRFDFDKSNYPEWYFTDLKSIEKISEDYKKNIPEFILEKDRKWCIHFPYDSIKTAIAINSDTSINRKGFSELNIKKI